MRKRTRTPEESAGPDDEGPRGQPHDMRLPPVDQEEGKLERTGWGQASKPCALDSSPKATTPCSDDTRVTKSATCWTFKVAKPPDDQAALRVIVGADVRVRQAGHEVLEGGLHGVSGALAPA